MARSNFPRVTVGGTFMSTWISSGVTPGVITATVYDGDEVAISNPAITDSGNGHYFCNPLVSTPGFYVLEWYAQVNGLDYRDRKQFKCVTEDVD